MGNTFASSYNADISDVSGITQGSPWRPTRDRLGIERKAPISPARASLASSEGDLVLHRHIKEIYEKNFFTSPLFFSPLRGFEHFWVNGANM